MTWQRLGEIDLFHAKQRKRVPYDMVDEYTPQGWVVVERHATYVTLEKEAEDGTS